MVNIRKLKLFGKFTNKSVNIPYICERNLTDEYQQKAYLHYLYKRYNRHDTKRI